MDFTAAGFVGAVTVLHIIVFKTFSHLKTPIVYFISLFPVKLFFLAHRHPNCVFAYVCDRLNEKKCIISDDSLFDISLSVNEITEKGVLSLSWGEDWYILF